MKRACTIGWLGLLLVVGCGEQHGTDGGVMDAAASDAAADDGGAGFDAGPPESCETPGASEDVPCGNCGSVERFCAASGFWVYGACEGEGECIAGTVDTIACGNCGTQAARCNVSCRWESTDACEGEGECAPGTRTRSGESCTAPETREVVCDDACTYRPDGMCELDACDTPGATEETSCGMCGATERFCTAEGFWEYGDCMREGECMPSSMGTVACGMCGTQEERCSAECSWAATGSACMDEGECDPSDPPMYTSMGCPAGQTRLVSCDASCGYVTEEPCAEARPLDVMLLLDVTGSNGSWVMRNHSAMAINLVRPLLALTDVAVGVSWYGDFPESPFGASGDRPFEGGIEPVFDETMIANELTSQPDYSGGDTEESGIEALSVLAGGAVHRTGVALSCSTGRIDGGCWRPGARRVVVMLTDVPNHNGPAESGSALHEPYSGITPTPAVWPDVLAAMMTDGTVLIVLMNDTSPHGQYRRMLLDLGQPESDQVVSSSASALFSGAVTRITALTMP